MILLIQVRDEGERVRDSRTKPRGPHVHSERILDVPLPTLLCRRGPRGPSGFPSGDPVYRYPLRVPCVSGPLLVCGVRLHTPSSGFLSLGRPSGTQFGALQGPPPLLPPQPPLAPSVPPSRETPVPQEVLQGLRLLVQPRTFVEFSFVIRDHRSEICLSRILTKVKIGIISVNLIQRKLL